MARGRKPSNTITSITWDDIFWKNLPTYINILNSYLNSVGYDLVEVSSILDKLPFKLPKGLNSKEIKSVGIYPVISQSKEFIIGFNDDVNLLIKENFPLIVFGDHSKTIKYVENPFIIGADGVKIIKPIKNFNEKFFYYFLHGVITDTKDYGRHYSLLRKGEIAKVTDLELQISIVNFLDDLNQELIDNDKVYFNKNIESKIFNLQTSQLKQIDISSQQNYQLDLIKQMRQAFLREAMQGKLVKSTNAKETGQQLLTKIKAEKAQLIAEKKLKKEKELATISEDEIPFEIPEHWAWCRGNDLAIYIDPQPSHRTPPESRDGVPYVAMSDIKKDGTIDFSSTRKVSNSVLEEHKNRYQLEEGDFIFGKIGTLGKPVLLPKPFEYTLSANVILIQANRKIIRDDYLFYFLGSPIAEKELLDKKSTTSYPVFGMAKARNMLIPLPPLHEQEQIVAKLEELMVFCDGLEQSIKESQGYNKMLLQQVLREALQGEEV
jgi:restriction endonuclease S subunit